MTVFSSRPRRELPSNAWVTGPLTVPVIATGRVTPLSVSSPSMSSSSSETRIAVERNDSCGLRSASKKSGESRWPLRLGSVDAHGGDVDRAPKAALVEGDVERAEAAAEVGDDHVPDGEADGRVKRIELPRAGRKCGADLGNRAHSSVPFSLLFDDSTTLAEKSLSRQVLTPQVSAQTVFARLLHAHGSLVRELEARLLAEHGLSANDFETLLHLSHAERGEMRRIDLAERLRLTAVRGDAPAGRARAGRAHRPRRLPHGRPRDLRGDHGRRPADARTRRLQRTPRPATSCIGTHLSPAELDELAALLGRLRASTTSTPAPAPAGHSRASGRGQGTRATLQRREPAGELVRSAAVRSRSGARTSSPDRDPLRRQHALQCGLPWESLDERAELAERGPPPRRSDRARPPRPPRGMPTRAPRPPRRRLRVPRR